MIELRSLVTVSPATVVSAADTHALLAALVPPEAVDRYRDLVDATGICRRRAVAPLRQLARLGGVAEREAAYARLAPALAEQAARRALAAAALAPAAIDTLIVASSTGHLVPTLAHHVAARLAVAPAARCLTLDGLGCAGAVRAMSLAADLLSGAAAGSALIVAVDLCSLWAPPGEISPEDARTSALMGDGAAAVVLAAGDGASTVAPQLVASCSLQWPDSLQARGATLTNTGLRHFSSPARIARLIAAHLRRDVEAFLESHGVSRHHLAFGLVNPSERRLAHAIADHLDFPPTAKAAADAVWREHGNTLAAGPVLMLRQLAESLTPADGDVGLLVALGPGITCDLLLLRWQGALPVRHDDATVASLS